MPKYVSWLYWLEYTNEKSLGKDYDEKGAGTTNRVKKIDTPLLIDAVVNVNKKISSWKTPQKLDDSSIKS